MNGLLAQSFNPAGIGIRFIAGIIDLIVLAIPFSVFVSFLAVGMNIWNSFFFSFHPGQPLPEDLARRAPAFVSLSLAFFAICSWLYFAILESSSWRGTIGKHLLGLRVADEHGGSIGLWQATKRFFFGRLLIHVPAIGAFYFVMDCLCIKLFPHNRAIHDRLSGCWVLRGTNDIPQ